MSVRVTSNPEAHSINEPAAFGVAHSFTGRRWHLRAVDQSAIQELVRSAGISPVLAHFLAARGVTPDTVADYLNPTIKRLLPDPSILKDMDKAVMRVMAALDARESIAVFGDYDVDGSTSAALLQEFFSTLGSPPRVYIPDRATEGYGPNVKAMKILKDEGASLLVTVDCGAAAVEALTEAKSLGLDVIVLDHHAVEIPPPAFAHVNPNQPGDTSDLGHLAAAGVVFLFMVALNRALRDAGWYEKNEIAEPDLRNALDLVGLATICDVVPLTGVNRAFVRGGLAKLARLDRHGLAALAAISKATAPFTPYHLGFVFGPRLNAGGRVGRGGLGVDLLTSPDRVVADEHALALDLHNRERQAIEKLILENAIAMASTQTNAPYILVANEGWHAGVVGIVAGRLKDRHHKPAFVVGFEGGWGRGSARSVAGIDLGAMVRAARDAGLLDAGGGHAMAAGFSLHADKLNAWREFLDRQFAGLDGAVAAASTLELDAMVSPSGASPELVEEISQAGPFGAGNPEPVFVAPDVTVGFVDVVGGDHVRLGLLGADRGRLSAICFRCVGTPLGQGLLAARGRHIHVAGRLKADEWQGKIRVQLQVEDAALADQ